MHTQTASGAAQEQQPAAEPHHEPRDLDLDIFAATSMDFVASGTVQEQQTGVEPYDEPLDVDLDTPPPMDVAVDAAMSISGDSCQRKCLLLYAFTHNIHS